MQNHFELFGLRPLFDIDMDALEAAFHSVQGRVHPDKFVSASALEKRIAMQWSTRATEAYQVLKHPLKRAQYICELHGVSLELASNTMMPPDFLSQQMVWREALAEAQNNPVTFKESMRDIKACTLMYMQQLAQYFVEEKYTEAAELIRQMIFLEKLTQDFSRQHSSLSHSSYGTSSTC